MKWALVFSLAWLSAAIPLGLQQSLPSQQQCKVDQKYFNAEAERALVQMMSSPKHDSDLSRLPVEELRKRSTEMMLCAASDPTNYNNYNDASMFFASFAEQREYDFIRRHHLLSEFQEEDEALVKAAGGK